MASLNIHNLVRPFFVWFFFQNNKAIRYVRNAKSQASAVL